MITLYWLKYIARNIYCLNKWLYSIGWKILTQICIASINDWHSIGWKTFLMIDIDHNQQDVPIHRCWLLFSATSSPVRECTNGLRSVGIYWSDHDPVWRDSRQEPGNISGIKRVSVPVSVSVSVSTDYYTTETRELLRIALGPKNTNHTTYEWWSSHATNSLL